ncbi:MAG: TonB C-terminal domain-containing protein [Gammaproteobacteria bacterium]|jgi:protein TonB
MSHKKRFTRHIPLILGIIFVSGVAGGVVMAIQQMLETPPQSKKFVQQISLVQPPPPPPPPPEVKQPEPEVEEVKVDEPEPMEDDMPESLDDLPPPGDQLGLDAEGGAGSDGFGLLGKKGGRGLLEGTEGQREFEWYTSTLQNDILDYLSERLEVRKDNYSIKVKLNIGPKGNIEDIRLMESTGDRETDKKIIVAFSEMKQVSEKPPQNMPQPVKLQINSRL